MKKNIKETITLFLKGGAVGVANIIPGVSGGTLAVILGIYDKLIESIAKFFENPAKRKEYILFLAKVFLGAVIALGLLANTMDFLLKQHFQKTMFLFMGLILGGIPAVIRSHGDMKVRPLRILFFVSGVVTVLSIAILGSGKGKVDIHSASVVMNVNSQQSFLVLAAGFLAGGAMIVPGVSGSFILVLMGQYATVIAAVKNLEVSVLALMAAGVVSGILVFSRIIKLCLEKAPSGTYYFILGLISASLYKIFPGIPEAEPELLICIGTFISGVVISCLLSKYAKIDI